MKIDCKALADGLLEETREKEKRGSLAIITVGSDPASLSYVKGKIKDCNKCGIKYEWHRFSSEADSFSVFKRIEELNADSTVGGIILQLPTPFSADIEKGLTNAISPEKDVDGFIKGSEFLPCTPEAVIWLLKEVCGNIQGKSVLLIGRGKLAGKPLIKMFIDNDCTLTVCHSKTKPEDLDALLYETHHDIVCTATPEIQSINGGSLKCDVLVDVGIGIGIDGKLHGNVYSPELGGYDYTSSPGGIGLLTRAFLMKHMETE